ncbi:11023_t:CDS:2 [Funneliformis caledonium]|uniref:11023_t:CDS:1 n=1 Tax=Funneliformis caledonium TaxID=1117310 RepID=A0A9N9ACA4_9GLOM|nr:11023_t:CDS:2 [Funneliformis caledonium]
MYPTSGQNNVDVCVWKSSRHLKRAKVVTPSKHEFLQQTHEKERTIASHEIFKSTWQNNFSSPVEDLLNAGGAKVLDAGCHPAAPWLMDMAKEYRNCKFFGTDILPIPEPKNKPKNLNFYQCDTLIGLPFENNIFDCLMEFDDKFWNGGPEGIDPYIAYKVRINSNIQHEEIRFYFGMPGRIGELINSHYSRLFTSYKNPIVDFVDDLSYDDYDEMIEKVLEEFDENHTSIKTSRDYEHKI